MMLRQAAALLCAALSCGAPAAAQSGRVEKAAGPPATDAARQTSCAMKQPPQVLGLRLGMSEGEVRAVFPRLSVSAPDEFGVGWGALRGGDVPAPPDARAGFGRVSDIGLEFTDGRLSYLRLGYPVTMRWKSSDEFLSRAAEWLDLPGGWKRFYDWEDKSFRDIEDFRDQALECEGFRVSVGIGVEGLGEQTPHVKLEDTNAARTVRARQDERARRERQASPPAPKP